MIDDYSFSTSWNCSQHEKGEEIVADITALGFRTIELNFQLNADKLRGILESVETGVVAVSSVHNYCPFPAETPLERVNPDDPSLASNEERVRKRAVEYTKRSIETAANLGARVLIIHSGKVAIASRTRKLIRLYQTKGESSKEFQMLRAAAIDERAHSVKEHFDALSTSYAELIPYAREKG